MDSWRKEGFGAFTRPGAYQPRARRPPRAPDAFRTSLCETKLRPARGRLENDPNLPKLLPSEAVVDEEGRDDLTGVKVGDVLAGKYRVERVLGVGAMGSSSQLTTKSGIRGSR